MVDHNKITVVREYCLARHIPYSIKGESLYINGICQIYSVYNISWAELIPTVNKGIDFDNVTGYFSSFTSSFAYSGNNL